MSADHIRGRVFFRKPAYQYRMRGGHVLNIGANYGMEVINTHTGKVIISDDCCNFTAIVRECHEAVEVARGAWFFSLHKRDLA